MAKMNAAHMCEWLNGNMEKDEGTVSPANFAVEELATMVEKNLQRLMGVELDCECPIGQCGGMFPDPDEVDEDLLTSYMETCPYCGVSPWGDDDEAPDDPAQAAYDAHKKAEKESESIEDFPDEDEEVAESEEGDIDSDLDDEDPFIQNAGTQDPVEDDERDEDPEPEEHENIGNNLAKFLKSATNTIRSMVQSTMGDDFEVQVSINISPKK
jgi:hypothetical protein